MQCLPIRGIGYLSAAVDGQHFTPCLHCLRDSQIWHVILRSTELLSWQWWISPKYWDRSEQKEDQSVCGDEILHERYVSYHLVARACLVDSFQWAGKTLKWLLQEMYTIQRRLMKCDTEVSGKNCETTVKIVSDNFIDIHLNPEDLSSERSSLRFAGQGHILAKHQIAEALHETSYSELHSDGNVNT